MAVSWLLKRKLLVVIPLILVLAVAVACGEDAPVPTPRPTATPQPTATPVDLTGLTTTLEQSFKTSIQEALKDVTAGAVTRTDIESVVSTAIAAIPEPPAGVTAQQIQAMVSAAVTAALPDTASPEEIRTLVTDAVAAATAGAVTKQDVAEAITKAVSDAAAAAPKPLSSTDIRDIVKAALPTPTATPRPTPTLMPQVQPKRGGTLIVSPLNDAQTLDPHKGIVEGDIWYAHNVFEKLFDADSDLTPQPQAVDQWRVSADGLTYRFTLRDGLTFHDGRPVTAQDVVRSTDRASQHEGGEGASIYPFTESILAVDQKTVVWTLTEPLVVLLNYLAAFRDKPMVIMPEETAVLDVATTTDSRIGSGPFKFVDWEPGVEVTFERYGNYIPREEPASGFAGGHLVYIDEMEWVIIPDLTTRVIALETGLVDYVAGTGPDDFQQLNDDPDIETFFERPDAWYYFGLNHLFPPFDNVNGRKALQALVDQERYMGLSFPEGLWQTCPALFGCDEPLDTPAGVPEYMVKGDLARAQEFWAQSGYDGQPIVVLSLNQTQPTINQGLALKEDLEALGANVDLVSTDGGTFFGRIFNSDPPDEGGWNIYGLWLTLATSPSFHGCLRTDQFGGNYDIPQMVDLKSEFLLAATASERKRLGEEMQRLFYDEAICVGLGEGKTYKAYRSYVNGVLTDAPAITAIFWNIWLDNK